MTTQQVEAVMLELRSGVIPQDLPDETLKTMSLHVRPLPFERTLAAVRRYVATPNLDGRPKFVSSVDELLTACEIPTKARGLVTLAAYDGGECWPDLRETSGWSYVARGAEPPQGVLEYRAVSAGALAEPERPALPAGGG
ncbi:MAG TPA: hypothetical protein VEA38_04100, partial [Terriglobales bacterium]|nr:hypothetical protein [Terriglobales bacterium]